VLFKRTGGRLIFVSNFVTPSPRTLACRVIGIYWRRRPLTMRSLPLRLGHMGNGRVPHASEAARATGFVSGDEKAETAARPRYDIRDEIDGRNLRVRLIDACNGNIDPWPTSPRSAPCSTSVATSKWTSCLLYALT
jgi:hypothetical protein